MTLLHTPWTSRVDPDNPLPEYPRPQLRRPRWLNLNGPWDYAILPRQQESAAAFDGRIIVPFPLESALSGVGRSLLPDQRLWYRRAFRLPEDWAGGRVLLHFGAVDWETAAWLNGQPLGVHRGGYDPFTFELTPVLRDGENELRLAVWDPGDTLGQPRGKQTLRPHAIWYTPVSGIWQTVWLEPVPQTFIRRLKLTPDLPAGALHLSAEIDGDPAGLTLEATALWEGRPVASGAMHLGEAGETGATHLTVSPAPVDGSPVSLPLSTHVERGPGGGASHLSLPLAIPDPHCWTPDTPYLYDLRLRLLRAGQEIDVVESYFGMRRFSLGSDAQGRPRLCLNGRPLFQYGPLDQGYWPDGLYTPPCEEAMLFDLEYCKRLGFNMLRKHVKVEPARYYYHCDRLGLIVWQDMPNGGLADDGLWPFIRGMLHLPVGDDRPRQYPRFGRADPENRENFQRELQAMIDALYNAVSIAMWVPFNEGWGQFDSNRIAAWVKAYDPTRWVDHASGFHDQGGGDCRSPHIYGVRLRPARPEPRRAAVLSEFGGYTLKVAGHTYDPAAVFGYKKFTSAETLTDAYLALLREQLEPWIAQGLSAAVYTQTSDVEIEENGFLTYDRQVEKMDAAWLAEAHRHLFEVGR